MLRARRFSFALLIALAVVAPASAGTFKVDSTADSPSANPGDGKCVSKAGGCTLRAAVEEANASDVGSTVEIQPGTYVLSIAPEGENFAKSGSLVLDGEITLSGQDFTTTIIDGGGIDRVFEVLEGATISIDNVTIQNGAAKGSDGGGLRNRGHLKMSQIVFQKNRATADPGKSNGRGGALHNEADASLMAVTLDQNNADGRGGAIYNAQGGSINMINGRISANESLTDNGGGVLNAGRLSLALLPVRGNKGSNGGGIDNVEGSLKMLDVLLADNQAGESGGGLRNSGTADLTNVTVGGNQSAGSGGGLDNRAQGKVSLNNVTVARNQAKGPGGGIHNGKDGRVALANTIVAVNTSGGQKSDCSGVVQSGGFNLIGTQAGCTLTGESEGNVLDKDPGLGELAAAGGATPTYAPAADSPAVDAGNPARPTGSDGSCAEADQRGVKRPQAGKPGGLARCDIGAVERKPG